MSNTTTITSSELETFNTVGFVRMQGVVPRADVEEMCDRVWALMAEQGILREDPTSWNFDATKHRGLNTISQLHQLKDGEPSPEDYPIVSNALDTVFGANERTPAPNWGQPLVTLPVTVDKWLMPSSIWHYDHGYSKPGEIHGVNVFLLMDDVEPGGGGTAVLRNSPLLIDRLLRSGARFEKISDQNKGFLGSHPWLRGLKVPKKDWNAERNNLYMGTDTDIDGIPARVEELTGKAGDVFISHPALYHAPAMNASSRPRLMRTQRVYSKALRAQHGASI